MKNILLHTHKKTREMKKNMKYLIQPHKTTINYQNTKLYTELTLQHLQELCQKHEITKYYRGNIKQTPYIEITTPNKTIHLIFQNLTEAYCIEELLINTNQVKPDIHGNFQNPKTATLDFPEKIIKIIDTFKKPNETYTEYLLKLVYDANFGNIIRIDKRIRTNSTGFLGVSIKPCDDCKQGFTWRYQYMLDDVRKEINRVNFMDLRRVVLDRNLKWGIIDVDVATMICQNHGYDINDLA